MSVGERNPNLTDTVITDLFSATVSLV